jgi:hypothetical protein
MNEIATVQPANLPATSTDLRAFVDEARQVYEIAKALASTSFVPVSMRDKPQEITGAILFGRELNMEPMTALQTIHIIQGRPTLTANAMRGLAMANGVRFRLDEATETRCVMSAMPPGGDWTTVTWTLDQAKKLGLTVKDNWKSQPGVMLIARATSQLCRLVAANILIGAPYSTEEIRDQPGDTIATAVVEPEKPKTRQIKRQPQPEYAEPAPTPMVDDNDVPEYAAGKQDNPVKEIGYSIVDDEKRVHPEGPVDRPDMVTTKTRAALQAKFGEFGLRNRNERLETVSKILNREILTFNQITEREAHEVLDILAHEWPPPAQVPS